MIRALTEGELEILSRTIHRLGAMAELASEVDDHAEALILKEEELLLHELLELDGVVSRDEDEDAAPVAEE